MKPRISSEGAGQISPITPRFMTEAMICRRLPKFVYVAWVGPTAHRTLKTLAITHGPQIEVSYYNCSKGEFHGVAHPRETQGITFRIH